MKKARENAHLVYLEAVNEHAKDLYIYFGFKVVDEAIIGQDIVNSHGFIKPGGEGVRCWAMVAEP